MPLVDPQPPPNPVRAAIRDLIVGRLALPTVDANIGEQLGSAVQTAGDATAVGERRVKGFTLNFPIHGDSYDANPYAIGNRMRRQLRSLMQNVPYRLSALYVQFAFDPERNGWMVMATGNLEDVNGGITLAEYQLTLDQVYVVGHRQTHREAFRLDVVDLRLSTSALDYLGLVVNTSAGFSSLPNLPLMPLPTGAADAAVLGAPVTLGQRTGQDGAMPVAGGLGNGDVVSWERAEADLNKGDVVVYDRRGNFGPFGTAGAYDLSPYPADIQAAYGWEEVYGPDYPYNWLTAGQTADVPALSNSLCRLRYDSSNTPGFKLDAWGGSTWSEQGKVVLYRYDTTNGRLALDTFVSASVQSYTPERAVIEVIMRASANPSSRELVYITLQRGWSAPRFEVYCAPLAGSVANVGADITFVAATVDTNDSAYAIDTAGLVGAQSAGSGSALLPGAGTALGAASFPKENWTALLRQGQGFSTNLAVLQPSAQKLYGQTTAGYGSARSFLTVRVVAGGYLSAKVGFVSQTADQVIEADAYLNAASTTASVVSDSGASAGSALRDTQAAATAATMLKTGSSLVAGAKYRVEARVREDAGANAVYKAVLGGTAGTPANKPFAAWTWVDLGEIVAGGSGQVAVYAYGGSTVGMIAAPSGLAQTVAPSGGQLAGGTYYYKVTAVKGAGETTGSGEVAATIPSSLPAPSGLARSLDAAAGALPNGSYFYVVTAVNANGETVGSSEVSAVFSGVLAAPAGLAASASDGGGGMSPGTYYYVVTATNANGETVGSAEVSGVIDAVLPAPAGVQAAVAVGGGTLPGGTYYYKVTAVNAAGETVGSSEVSALIGALPAPSGVAVAAANGGTLAAGTTYYWKVTAINGSGETVGSSEVSLAAAAGIATPSGVSLTAYSTGGHLLPSTKYYYRVTAVNARGETVGSTEASTTTPTASATPPTYVSATWRSGASPPSMAPSAQVGDVVVMMVSANYAGTTGSFTTPSNAWTQIGATSFNGRQAVAYFYLQYAGTLPSGTFAFSGAAITLASVITYRNVGVPSVFNVQTNPDGVSNSAGNAGVTPSASGGAFVYMSSLDTGNLNFYSGTTYQNQWAARAYYNPGSYGLVIAINTTLSGVATGELHSGASTNYGNTTLMFWLPPLAGGTARVALSWSAVTGATGYRVYRSTTAGGEATSPALVGTITSGSTTSFTDTAAGPSAGSVPVAGTTAANAAALSWGAVTGATGYNVYRATTAGGESGATSLVTAITDASVTAYTDTGSATTTGAVPATNTSGGAGAIALLWTPVAGASGYNVYRATTAGGETGATSLVTSLSDPEASGWTDTGATAFAGSVPGSNTAAVTTGSVGLSWSAVGGATGYNIYRATSPGGETSGSTLLASVQGTAFTDIGSATGAGAAPASNTAALGTGQVSLTWTAVSGATGYNVYRAGTTGGETSGSTQLAAGLSSPAFVDDGSVTPAAVAAPTSNTAAVTGGSVALTWTAVSGATGYRVYRAGTSGGESTTPALVGTASSNSFTDVGAAPSAGSVPATNTTGGAGAYLDRVEAVKIEDRTRTAAPYDGARDHGQAHLADVRPQAQRVARA